MAKSSGQEPQGGPKITDSNVAKETKVPEAGKAQASGPLKETKPTEVLKDGISQLLEESSLKPIELIAPNIKKEKMSREEAEAVIDCLADSHGIPRSQAFVAIALIALKGGSNKGAPETMSVDVLDSENKVVTVQKYDIIYAIHAKCKHKFIRRLSEALALEISLFAKKHNLTGDLATKLNNNLVKEEKEPLSPTEKAFASSFCQSLPDLVKHAGERIPTLLAKDYDQRFLNRTKKEKVNKETGIRKSGAGKGQPTPKKE